MVLIFSTLVLSFVRELIFVSFAYIIPALSSVKAILHHDVDAYHQWVTYFVILYVYQSIPIHIVIPNAIQVPFIMWLSLPQFQGALWVYKYIFQPQILDRYEKDIDERLSEIKRRANQKVWDCCGYFGWTLLSQIGVIVSIIRGDDTKEEISDSITLENKENSSKPEQRRPHHSLVMSSTSLSSIHSDDSECNDFEKEQYIKDFLELLQCGLYVFATCSKEQKSSNQEVSYDYEILLEMKNKRRKRETRLSVLSYVHESDSLVISTIGETEMPTDSKLGTHFPLKSQCFMNESGAQGIEIISSHHHDFVMIADIVLSDTQERDILLEGLKICMTK